MRPSYTSKPCLASLFYSLGAEPRLVQVRNLHPRLVHPLCGQSPASCGSAEMTQLGSAPPTWSNLTLKKGAELMFCGHFSRVVKLQPPDETPNELVRNANIKHQPRCFSSDQYGIRSVGVRCAQSSSHKVGMFRLLLLPPPAGTSKLVSSSATRVTSIPAAGG